MKEFLANSGELFLHVFNISIMASWLVLAVIIARLCLKRAPKWVNCVLWALVAIRLLVPFNFESALSLVPSSETITKAPDAPRPHFESGVTMVDNQVNDYLQGHYFEGVTRPAGHFVDVTTIVAIIWFVGVVALLIYALISYLKVKKSVAEAMKLQEKIYLVDKISTPFILGVINPKIYIPSSLSEEDVPYVIEHETAHIKRLDNLWKPLGFLVLAFYWFNPVMWVAYIFLCKDIEFACDERAIKNFDSNCRKEYSNALINCSSQRRLISACPLAFGETGVKNRIKTVLNYKKPAFWIVIVSVVVCIAVAVAFLTSPLNKAKEKSPDNKTASNTESTTETTSVPGVIDDTTASQEEQTKVDVTSEKTTVSNSDVVQTTTSESEEEEDENIVENIKIIDGVFYGEFKILTYETRLPIEFPASLMPKGYTLSYICDDRGHKDASYKYITLYFWKSGSSERIEVTIYYTDFENLTIENIAGYEVDQQVLDWDSERYIGRIDYYNGSGEILFTTEYEDHAAIEQIHMLLTTHDGWKADSLISSWPDPEDENASYNKTTCYNANNEKVTIDEFINHIDSFSVVKYNDLSTLLITFWIDRVD